MKLRIAEIAGPNNKSQFIIQKRTLLFWWKMDIEITDGAFNDFHSALKEAKDYLAGIKSEKDRIINSWEV
jgi:hypothetical protein